MTTPEETSQASVDEQAATWFTLQLDHPFTSQQRQDFEHWYQQDPRHAAAYDALQAIWDDSAHVLQTNTRPQAEISPVRKKSVQNFTRPLLALAASLVMLLLIWPGQPTADYQTRPGEQQQVQLPDGSTLHLSSNTALALHYSDTERRLQLLHGSAWFQVAPDAQRPFRVAAAGGETTALGTAFAVTINRDHTEVLVTEHQVAVSLDGQQTRLQAGQAARYDRQQLHPAQTVDPAIRLAWLNQQLVFINQPLEQVVDELQRWHSGRLVLLGEQLAQRPVTLMFDLQQGTPIDKLVQGLNLKTLSLGSHLTFIYQ